MAARAIDLALDLLRVELELRNLQAEMEAGSAGREVEFKSRLHALLDRQNALAHAIHDFAGPHASAKELVSISP